MNNRDLRPAPPTKQPERRIESTEINTNTERQKFIRQFILNRCSNCDQPVTEKLVKEANAAWEAAEKLVK